MILAVSWWSGACSRSEEPTKLATPTPPPPTAEDVKRESGEAFQTLRAYTASRQAEYAKTVDGKLAELNHELTGLKSNAAQAGAEARTKANEVLTDLDHKFDGVRRRLNEFKVSQTNTWENLRAGVDSGLQELRDSLDKVRETLE